MDPRISNRAPGSCGDNALIIFVIRSASSIDEILISISAAASAGTTFGRVPPWTTPTVTVVPRTGSVIF